MTLEIYSGSFSGRTIRLAPGERVSLGRTTKADFDLPDDSHLSGVHFVLECDEEACRVRDLNSRNGTQVNGERVTTAVLKDGDEIVAGETRFLVRIEETTPATASAPIAKWDDATAPRSLLAMLQEDFQPLYALLDAARAPAVFQLLVRLKAEYKSLFQGTAGAKLTHFAPYLVRLPPRSRLLKALVSNGWGKGWGVFLTCPNPLHEVRKHFRQFLMSRLPDGEQVYFRFYDPRVLRVYLPTCLPEEVNQFFGPVKYFLTEDEQPEGLLRFSNAGPGVGRRRFPLAPER